MHGAALYRGANLGVGVWLKSKQGASGGEGGRTGAPWRWLQTNFQGSEQLQGSAGRLIVAATDTLASQQAPLQVRGMMKCHAGMLRS